MIKKKTGFTLVELLVAITIVAILSTIALTLFNDVQKKARDVKRKGDIETIAKAFEVKYSQGSYSKPLDTWFGSGGIPKDSINNDTYYYSWNGGKKDTLPTAASPTYTICAKLETLSGNASDKGDGTTFAYVSDNTGEFFCRKNLQ